MNSGGSTESSAPRKPAIAPKPSSLKSPPLPHKHHHGPIKSYISIPTPKPRKLQATQSSPVPGTASPPPVTASPPPVTASPPPVKAKTFQNAGNRANSEDSGVFDLRDSGELSKSELISEEVQDSIVEEPAVTAAIPDSSDVDCQTTASRAPPVKRKQSPKHSPPKPLPKKAPLSPIPPPRRAKSVIDPTHLKKLIKPKLNKSTDDLTSFVEEEEKETDPVKQIISPLERDSEGVPPPIPPHKNSTSPRPNPKNIVSTPRRPPPPNPRPSAPPVHPKPTNRKIQSQLVSESSRVCNKAAVDLPGEDASPVIPPRTRRSVSRDDSMTHRSSPERSRDGDETIHIPPRHGSTNGQQDLPTEEQVFLPPKKRWSQLSSSSTTAIPYHKVQSPLSIHSTNDPTSPKSPEVQILDTSCGIVGYKSVAPPRPLHGPPKHDPPKNDPPTPPPPYISKPSTALKDLSLNPIEQLVPPPRPPPLRSALPPKPASLLQNIGSSDDNTQLQRPTSPDRCSPSSQPCSTTEEEDEEEEEYEEQVSDDDEYVFPDSPFYENREFDSLTMTPHKDSAAPKRPVPGRQKRVPPAKPVRTPSIHSDVSNDGYEDMSRGPASLALSSISAEVYSVPRSCERSNHDNCRYHCAATDFAEQSSCEEEDGSQSEDEDSYEKVDQEVSVEKEDVDPDVRRKQKAFLVAQELRDSERAFVDVLKLVNEDFKAAIDNAEKSEGRPIVEKGTLDQILGRLPQLQTFNEDLLSDLDSRITNWSENPRIADIFLKKGPYLKLYNTYIRDFQKLTGAIDEACLKWPLFNAALREFEASPRCRSLGVKEHMLKPIQRIPQYKLLLTEYLKQLDGSIPDDDYKDTQAALNIVSEVANHVNESMREGDNLDKLLQLQQSLVGNLEIVRPGRVFLKEGDLLKLSRKVPQTRRFYLLSDILLYTTPFLLTPGQYNYKLHNVLSLAGMRVNKPLQEDYKNEFSIISVQRSFTLAASSPEERDSWISTLNRAITDYAGKRSSFAMLHPHYSQLLMEGDTMSLGRKAPAWIPDGRVTMCMICTCEFTITWRRHHCRACGKVICGHCSSNKVPLKYLANKVARACDQCFKTLCKEDGQGEEAEETKDRGKLKSKRKKSARLVVRPSALKQVSGNDRDTTMSGYLMVRRKKDWKKQWFVLKDKVLYRYKASEDVAALESRPLLGYDIQARTEPFDGVDPSLILQLSHQSKVLFILRAETKGMAEKWTRLMLEATHL